VHSLKQNMSRLSNKKVAVKHECIWQIYPTVNLDFYADKHYVSLSNCDVAKRTEVALRSPKSETAWETLKEGYF